MARIENCWGRYWQGFTIISLSLLVQPQVYAQSNIVPDRYRSVGDETVQPSAVSFNQLNFGAIAGGGTAVTPANNINDIDVSSQFGLDGNIDLETLDLDPTRGLDNLPVTLIDVANLITRNCLGGGDERLNEFVITGRGGLPSNPQESLPGEAILLTEWVNLAETKSRKESTNPDLNSTQPQPIVETKTWQVKPDGTVVLVSESDKSNLIVPRLDYQSCDRH